MSHNIIFTIYGEGGHRAQMIRLINHIRQNDTDYIDIIDSKLIARDNSYITYPIRKKSNNNIIYTLFSVVYNFIFSVYLIAKLKPKAIISTGPSICIPFFVIAKIFRVKTIYIETWSRFYSKSFTAKFAYPLVDYFYYQNNELEYFYPNGIYCGRL
ncbi:PssD/Cps14F family polysaccharide biosynthesis glycosyltransferase [Aliivibrio fischeri]|uniref:PssD/Cps14F family polysaccharide biosynthesis glycosyltransferase n=1 Tax=Aliivibrio fischeri TaxID=668 RepID=UPI0018C66313|nr:PssD/Cps14F family polysaccharide biosynthesis glycosyltransferase [Aliivibrio fischeri]